MEPTEVATGKHIKSTSSLMSSFNDHQPICADNNITAHLEAEGGLLDFILLLLELNTYKNLFENVVIFLLNIVISFIINCYELRFCVTFR